MPLKGKGALMRTVRGRSDKLVRAFALEFHRRLIQKTPVDKGRARNNWNMATGSPDESTTDSESYQRGGGEAMQKGLAQVANFRAGDVIYDTNSLPYIVDLDEGSSKQAPQGMIRLTVEEMKVVGGRIVASIASGE